MGNLSVDVLCVFDRSACVMPVGGRVSGSLSLRCGFSVLFVWTDMCLHNIHRTNSHISIK